MTVLSVFMEEGRPDSSLRCVDKSLTKQSFTDECDINKIIQKYEKQGLLTHVSEKVAIYGDFTGIGDLHESMLAVHAAEDMFMALPAAVRERFDNDPEKLMVFLQDPKNVQEGIDLGLLTKRDAKGGDTPLETPAKPAEAAPKGAA